MLEQEKGTCTISTLCRKDISKKLLLQINIRIRIKHFEMNIAAVGVAARKENLQRWYFV